MSIRNSIAIKKRWAKIPKAERSRRMSIVAKIGQSKISPEEKSKIGRRMAKIKKLKNK